MNGANPVRGEAELLVGGETLALRPSFGRDQQPTLPHQRLADPQPGTRVWDKSASLWRYWDGSAWSDGSLPAAGLVVAGQRVVGPRQPTIPSPSGGTTIDAEARAAVASVIVALETHGLID